MLTLRIGDFEPSTAQQLAAGDPAGHRDYWLRQLSGELPVVTIPADRPRPAVKTYNGAVVSIAICRELGPVLTALMVTGRVGAAMSAEIGTMKVTEQIDALRALAVYPTDYLVVPRALAMMVSMPLLVAECIAVGIASGYFIAIFLLEINGTYYMANMVRWTRNRDIIMGLTKAFCSGILIVFISCHKGLTAREGAVGVGRATTEAVVNASLAVLICNFFLTMLLNIIYPAGYQ